MSYKHVMKINKKKKFYIKLLKKNQLTMNKGLDAMFMNFGIRNEDMEIIKNIGEEAQINFDLVLKILFLKVPRAKIKKIKIWIVNPYRRF